MSLSSSFVTMGVEVLAPLAVASPIFVDGFVIRAGPSDYNNRADSQQGDDDVYDSIHVIMGLQLTCLRRKS